jgi:hypothetical protein
MKELVAAPHVAVLIIGLKLARDKMACRHPWTVDSPAGTIDPFAFRRFGRKSRNIALILA